MDSLLRGFWLYAGEGSEASGKRGAVQVPPGSPRESGTLLELRTQ